MKKLMIAFCALISAKDVDAQGALQTTAYDFSFTSIEGQPLPLSQFSGKVLLIVNTASYCGFTKQYSDLQALWSTYKERGFVVLGVPSNDFGAQEPGSANEIQEFCEVNFDINFPMTDKYKVSGDGAHPFYKWARAELGYMAAPKWNFHKYLIGPDGRLMDWFSTTTKPSSSKVQTAIERLLTK